MTLRAATEADIQRVILHYLGVRGALATRVNSGAVKADGRFFRLNSSPGCSDILVCYRGSYIALEVKRPGKKATAVQESFLAAVRKAGGVGAVVTGVADVERILDEVDDLDDRTVV